MTTTTEYGSWARATSHDLSVFDTVRRLLGEYADDYNLPGVIGAYRGAINEALPEGVSLCGDEFYGPHPKPAGMDELISEAVAGVDFFALAERFDKTRED